MCAIGQAGGIVLLTNIIAPCPLIPVLPDTLIKGTVTPENCMETVSSFYLNPFASHLDYALIR